MRKSLTHQEGVEREEKSESARRREGEHHSANDLNPMNSGGFGGVGWGGGGGPAQSSIEEDEECMRAFPPLSLCCPASVPRGDKQGAHKQG